MADPLAKLRAIVEDELTDATLDHMLSQDRMGWGRAYVRMALRELRARRRVAPELLAVVEAAERDANSKAVGYLLPDLRVAVRALLAKLEENQ